MTDFGTEKMGFLQTAIQLASKGMAANEGGPFGCVIVKEGRVVGAGNNKVLANNDPTAHAEIVAIRAACANLGSFQLTDCEIYSTCEPCPMCLGAIYWARPKAVYFGSTKYHASEAGFDDSFIYNELNISLTERKVPAIYLTSPEAESLFTQWKEKQDKTGY